MIPLAPAPVQITVVRGEGVAIRTQEAKVHFRVVQTVAVNVVNGQWHLPRNRVAFLPATLLTALSMQFNEVAADITRDSGGAGDP
jgi:hypothetical protein